VPSARICSFTVAALLALGLVAGCAPLPHTGALPHEEEQASLAQLVGYYAYAQTLSPDMLRQELVQAEHDFARQADAPRRLRLVLLLSVTNPSLMDRARARALLRDYLAEPRPQQDRWYATAGLIAALLTDTAQEQALLRLQGQLQDGRAEQERLAMETRQLRQQLQETQADSAHHAGRGAQLDQQLQAVTAQLHKQLEQERATARKLRQQLEALKNIEKQLLEQRLEKPGT
jgi:hypothetical protein